MTTLRNFAPSTALRKWYGRGPAKFDEFRARYRGSLLTATKDVDHSQAAVPPRNSLTDIRN